LDYQGGTALALVMLTASFTILIVINGLQWRRTRRAPATVRDRPPLVRPPDGALPVVVAQERQP